MFLLMVVYLLLVLIRPQDYPVLIDTNWLPMQPIALLAAAGVWLFSARKSFSAPQYALLGLFLLVLMFSKVVNGWTGGALVQLTKFAPVLLAFVLLANATNTRQRVVAVMAVFALCAAVLAVHGIDQAATGIGWTGVGLSQETRIQYVGIFNDPNDLGLLFVMSLPMAVYLGGRGGLMGLRRLFWMSVAAVLLYGIYLTNSRGTLVALIVVLGVYLWQRRGLVVAGIMGVAAFGGLLLLPSRLQGMEVGEASAMGRVESWYEGLHMFLASPVFGVGADAYSDIHYLTAHNSFVLVLAETGIIGFTVWLAFIGYCFRMVFAVLGQRGPVHAGPASAIDARDAGTRDGPGDAAVMAEWQQDRAIALTLLLALCGFFVSAFFLSRSYVVILYLLAALVVAHYVGMRRRYPSLLPGFALSHDLLRWPVWSVMGVLGLYLTVKVLLALA